MISKIKLISIISFSFILLLQQSVVFSESVDKTYSESEFLILVLNKPIDDVRNIIGEPVDIVKKGDMEHFLYEALVHQQGKEDKIFKYTQLSVTKGYVQNIGNSNRVSIKQ